VSRGRGLSLAALAAVATAACGEAEPAPPPTLADATLVFAGFDSLSVDLSEGQGEVREGEVVVARAGLTDWVVQGDLDGNGTPEAVAVVWVSDGGSGTFFELALLELSKDADGVPDWSWRGSALLGDRIRVRALTLDEAMVELHVTDHGPEDGMCCPTHKTVRRFRVTPNGFDVVGGEDDPRVGAENDTAG
jgi:hypothetical protein